jgi:hypothetical protein
MHQLLHYLLFRRLSSHIASQLAYGAASASSRRSHLGTIPLQSIHSEAALAKLCGACPVPASSGTTTRHRLNRGGHRQANAALHRILIVRTRFHEPTVNYVTRGREN